MRFLSALTLKLQRLQCHWTSVSKGKIDACLQEADMGLGDLFQTRNSKRREFLNNFFEVLLSEFNHKSIEALKGGPYYSHLPSMMEIGAYLYTSGMEVFDEYKPRRAKVGFSGIKYDHEAQVIRCLSFSFLPLFEVFLRSSSPGATAADVHRMGLSLVDYSRQRHELYRNEICKEPFDTLIDENCQRTFLLSFLEALCLKPIEPDYGVSYRYACDNGVPDSLMFTLKHNLVNDVKTMFANFQ